jgi:choline dehydrogenase
MYDYIVVGAGSAGCVLAARLSEDANVNVLLIEAGPPDTLDNIHIPLGITAIARSAVDWDMWTGHEPALDGRRVYLPRGRMLGGCSSNNAMVYIRGNAADYDGWRDVGCEGWGYSDLLPYFKRSEDNERGESYYHGVGGPLAVSEGRNPNPMMDAVVEAGIQSGLTANDDFNGAAQDGLGHYQVTQRDGRRCSASVAFLHPAMARPNLTVECGVQVERVLFTGGTRAVGVEGRRLGELVQYDCSGEVIISAGAYQSPQLLMLSGIGPAEHLGSRLIPPLVHNPEVGRNLQDHVQIWAQWRSAEPASLADAMSPEKVEANVMEFETKGSGPLTSNVAQSGGFVRSSDNVDAPDLQIHAIPALLSEDPPFGQPEHGISIGVCLLTPTSRGEVFLATPEGSAKPHIMHRYFAEEEDMRRMEIGVGLLMDIARQRALEPYCSEPEQVPSSGAEADMRAFIRRHAQTLYHPVGTCAMGTVVDNELRVNGVDGLRVVDASVMPTVPRGNTNAPTIALAERAADVIKGVPTLKAETPAEAPA